MFDETKYIVEASKKVKLKNKSRRCIFINIKEAQKIGLDIEGMVGLSMSQEERVQLENDSYL